MQSMPYYQQQQGYQPQASYPPQAPNSNVLNNGPGGMMGHPNGAGLPPMQHPGLPDSSQHIQTNGQHASKRKQVKNACTNCQKACKKCDDARPCPRCVKYGIADTCVNSVRKERKKGIKRGPYKRRQKTGEDKPRKNTADLNSSSSSTSADQHGQPSSQYASMRGSTMQFSYPSNLNQYGQSYDPYGQYATYHDNKPMMAAPQPYVVNPVYPPMGYPVMVAGGSAAAENGQPQSQQQQQAQPQQPAAAPAQQHPYQQHYSNMMHQQQQQQNSPQAAARPLMMQQHNEHVMHQPSPAGSPQVYYQPSPHQQHQHQHQQHQHQQHPQQHHQQNQNHSQPPSQRNSPHLPEIKPETLHSEAFAKHQNMTPVASTSTSTATTSSPDSTSWAPPRS